MNPAERAAKDLDAEAEKVRKEQDILENQNNVGFHKNLSELL